MKILALDSSGLVASVAIIADGTLLAEYTVNYKKTHSQTLLPMLDEIARMVELDRKTIDAIAVAAGPGSFTGLRIGSATAKGLGLALGKPIVEVPTLAGIAYNLGFVRGLVCPVMDARRQQVYSGIYRFEGDRLITVRDQTPVSVTELIAELEGLDDGLTSEGIIFLGDGVPVLREEADRTLSVAHSYAPAHLCMQRAGAVGVLAAQLYSEGKYVPAEKHTPIYLRKSQAEQQRDRMNGNNTGNGPAESDLISVQVEAASKVVGELRARVQMRAGKDKEIKECDGLSVPAGPDEIHGNRSPGENADCPEIGKAEDVL